MDHQPTSSDIPTTFLPDFCGLRVVFAVVVIGEMLALVLTLAPVAGNDRWSDLGLVSLFVQWVALTGTAMLCLLRRHLARLGDVPAATLAYLLLLAVTAVVSLVALALAARLGLDQLLPAGWRDGFFWRSLAIGAIAAAVSLRYFYVRHQWQRQVLVESRAHLEALQARIRPHFLFNSLNTVASLTRTRPELAETTIEDLAELFRASLGNPVEGVPLALELELANRYPGDAGADRPAAARERRLSWHRAACRGRYIERTWHLRRRGCRAGDRQSAAIAWQEPGGWSPHGPGEHPRATEGDDRFRATLRLPPGRRA